MRITKILKRSKKLPKDSSIQFVIGAADGHVYGCIGLARELVEREIVRIDDSPEYYDPDTWLTIRTIGHHDVTECSTREEALEKFKEDEDNG